MKPNFNLIYNVLDDWILSISTREVRYHAAIVQLTEREYWMIGGHDGTTWVPDNTIRYTFTGADVAFISDYFIDIYPGPADNVGFFGRQPSAASERVGGNTSVRQSNISTQGGCQTPN